MLLITFGLTQHHLASLMHDPISSLLIMQIAFLERLSVKCANSGNEKEKVCHKTYQISNKTSFP